MATRFDGFNATELMALVAGLCAYEATFAAQGNYCPVNGPAPSRDALIFEAQKATNYNGGNYPDLSGLNVGQDFTQSGG
jgi:hypothetical protein